MNVDIKTAPDNQTIKNNDPFKCEKHSQSHRNSLRSQHFIKAVLFSCLMHSSSVFNQAVKYIYRINIYMPVNSPASPLLTQTTKPL